ncbi:MAG TPA: hypothetical protein VFQ68_17770 [Streptosporangiaceae bacterium]|nr:hypothetical protein [Streptosporangiaceae bacterium]
MEYVSRVPAPPLDLFIDDIYCLTVVPRHRRMTVPPMPSAHLLVNLGGPARLRDSDPSVPPAVLADGWFMGVWTRRFLVEYPAWGGSPGCTSSPGDFAVRRPAGDRTAGPVGAGRRRLATIPGPDPHVVIQGDRVLHLKFKVRR